MFMVLDSPEPAYNFAFWLQLGGFLIFPKKTTSSLSLVSFSPNQWFDDSQAPQVKRQHPWSWTASWTPLKLRMEVGSWKPTSFWKMLTSFFMSWQTSFSCFSVSSFLELGTSHTFHYQSLDPTSDSHGTWTWTPRSLFGIHIHANQSYIHRETLGWGPLNNQAHIHLTLRGYLLRVYPYIHVGKLISIYTSMWLNHFPGLVIQIKDTWLVRTNLTLLLICSSI